MSKILFFTQGEHIAKHAERLKRNLADPDEMLTHPANIENIVQLAKKLITPDIEVVLARSTCAYLLRKANVPVSVVEIPISEAEFIAAITKARDITPAGGPIGLLGFRKIISSMKNYSKILSIDIRLYEMYSTHQAMKQIQKAKQDGVLTLITGYRCVDNIRDSGLNAVLLEASAGSVSRAYNQAKEILHARTLEKKKARETTAILNSVSDGIVGFDAAGKPTIINQSAARIFDRSPDAPDRGPALFSPQEQDLVGRVIRKGEEVIGHVLERQGRKYAVRIVPVIVNDVPEGAIATLHEIHALQRMEANVRKRLSPRGNVAKYVFDDILGRSGVLREAVEAAHRFAGLESNVLLLGETGTGKELFAQSIHNASPRREQPFVAVNCGAIPPHLIVSELFGYEDGAFTGARKGGNAGLFELAHNGTIFLDEISEMDSTGQVNLLRALQERQIRRVGGNNLIPVNVRVIAACNTNLYQMVRENKFRRDLYYRLSVLVIRIPALRERRGDIAVLARHFMDQYNRRFAKRAAFSDAALRELEGFHWDGNVRQLRNFCEQTIAVADSPVLDDAYVREQLRKSLCFEDAPAAPAAVPTPDAAPDDVIVIKGKAYSKTHVAELSRQFRGRRELLAKKLGVCRTTLWNCLRQL